MKCTATSTLPGGRLTPDSRKEVDKECEVKIRGVVILRWMIKEIYGAKVIFLGNSVVNGEED
ncbi:hypothetical protein J7K52_03070 [Candidatus Bathyarchaeota archaeon]|nr:hypothetical protein [Candidatus Bathyarchaeota archaeon]